MKAHPVGVKKEVTDVVDFSVLLEQGFHMKIIKTKQHVEIFVLSIVLILKSNYSFSFYKAEPLTLIEGKKKDKRFSN